MKIKNIMIVEDDLDISQLYQMKLEMEGFNVLSCSDGFTAITKLVDFRPDLILLDLSISKMDGEETLGVIKNLTTTFDNTYIYIFSNNSDEDYIKKILNIGADGYFFKAETTPKILIEKINQINLK